MGWSKQSVAPSSKKQKSIVASRGYWYIQPQSTATTTGNTFRTRHISGPSCSSIQLLYANKSSNPINVKFSVEYNSQIYPVTFQGQSQATLLPGNNLNSSIHLITDPISVYISAGSTFYVRTFVNVTSIDPTVAPTLTAVTPGTATALAAGSYEVVYTYTTPNGETVASPISTVTISAGQEIQVSSITPPSGNGINGVKYYMSTAAGGTTLGFDASGTGAQINLTTLPASGAAAPPSTSNALVYPVGLSAFTSAGEGAMSGDQTSTNTTSGIATAYAFSPIAIIGNVSSPSPSVLFYGDSIAFGAHDNDPVTGSGDNFGFIVRSLNSANLGWAGSAESGEQVGNVNDGVVRHTVDQFATHAIVEYGINDIANGSSLSTLQTNLQNFWNWLASAGVKVYQTTITPYSSSTDGFVTLVNQTPEPNCGPNSIRTQLNDWIRTTPSPLSGYFETADTVESSRNSGLWKVNGSTSITVEGLHPNPTGNQWMQAAINTTLFTL